MMSPGRKHVHCGCAACCPTRRQLVDLVSALCEEASELEHKVPRSKSRPTVASLRCARLIRRVLAVNAAHHAAKVSR